MNAPSTARPGRLFLIPTPLMQPEECHGPWLPEAEHQRLIDLTEFYVETPKTARRWLGLLGLVHPIQQLNLHPLPDRAGQSDCPNRNGRQDGGHGRSWSDDRQWLAPVLAGRDAGLLSDAGCPGVADPGALLVAAAHRLGVEVIPLVGPSSILLGLMASGFNGQQFAFHGYLPVQPDQRAEAIEKLARRSSTRHETAILIETPYRNQAMADALIRHLPESARLCIATDLTGQAQRVQTRTVAEWRRSPPILPDKRPALFLFLCLQPGLKQSQRRRTNVPARPGS
ncbi:MAG: SAM-dependent methyltransferase [Lautropia sp.]|nr:SAM-dependent methyltransferase [Lautropia sp.]